ncbi:MAG: Do family serine endopeptidase [Halofilum sp. (in: g-proteobacteria)]
MRTWIGMLAASTGLALALAGPATASAATVPDFTRIVEDNRAAVVNIATTQNIERDQSELGLPEGMLEQLPPGHPLRDFLERFGGRGNGNGDAPQQRQAQSLGSGLITTSDGYIMTNAHVVAQADEIVVKLHDNRELDAEVVGVDERSDVGLLKIDATDLPTATIGNSDDLQVGEWLLAIGAPFGLDYTATQGIVSALDRSLPNDTYTAFIQTDVAVNPGNSGGPLFNADGEVVGINSQIFSRTGGYMGLSFAVPINTAMHIAEQLRETGTVERGYLGVTVQPVDRGLAESFGLERTVGALVADVVPDGPAGHADLQAGDVILEFNGQPVDESSDLPPLVGRTPVGEEAEVMIMREGERQTVTVTVGALSDYEDSTGGQRQAQQGPGQTSLNVGLRPLTSSEREDMGLGDRGLLVEEVDQGPVAQAGIRPGDILLRIGPQPLSTVGQFEEAVAKLPAGRPVAVQLRRGNSTLFVSLTLPEQ